MRKDDSIRPNVIIANLMWRFLERTGAQIVTIIVSIVLARLLGPSVYGRVALINVIISILSIFVDSGMGNALIQKKDVDEIDFSSVFYFNLCMCGGLYLCIYMVAPFIASFYKDTELVSLLRVSALILIISGLKNIQQAYVARNMLFKKFFWATLVGTVVSAIGGILMALAGFEIWAIVIQQLLNPAIDTLILWITIGWKPIKAFSIKRLLSLFHYGWKILASSLLQTSYNKVFQLVISKSISASELAYYEKGQQFPQVVYSNIVASIDSVIFSVLSKKQDSETYLKNMMRRSISMGTYIMTPIMMGMMVIAKPMVLVLLGNKWLHCVSYLYVVAIAGILSPITTIFINVTKAVGRSDIILRNEIISNVVFVLCLLIFIRYGRVYLLASVVLAGLFSFFINMFSIRLLIHYSLSELVRDVMLNVSSSVIMSVIVLIISRFVHVTLFVNLCVSIIGGSGGYLIISALTHNKNYEFIRGAMLSLFKKK